MIKLLYKNSVSASFVLDNNTPYFSQHKYSVVLDNQVVYKDINTNVFSLFNLKPNTSYSVATTIDNCKVDFITNTESIAIDVKDFFAQGDGETDDTSSIQAAVDCCPKNGRVYFGQGVYLTAPLNLKSDITIDIDKDAVLQAIPCQDRYPLIPAEVNAINGGSEHFSSWEGCPLKSHKSFLSAYFASNISLTGQGIIDGCGHLGGWYDDPKNPNKARPRLLFFNGCRNIALHGLTLKNSASWTVHPFFCKEFLVYNCKIQSHKDSPNTDGLNPESCNGVDIVGVEFSTGDDCIALKSGKFYMGNKYKTPTQNVRISNCRMLYGHGSVVFGSELSGGLKNIDIRQCEFVGNDRGIRIKTRRGRGEYATIENVTISNIVMNGVKTPFVINSFYNCDKDGHSEWVQSRLPQQVDNTTPKLGEFCMSDIVCKDVEFASAVFLGLPEAPIKSIALKNISISMAKNANSGLPIMCDNFIECSKKGIVASNIIKLILDNVKIKGVSGEQLLLDNVSEVVTI